MGSQIQNGQRQLQGPHDIIPAEIPVLIVGGGPIGLTTSLLLSHFGIRSFLIEQHPGTSPYPKSRFIKARTMEIFRQIGLEQSIREVAIPHTRNAIWARSLAGEELNRRPIETALPDPVRDWSPTWGCTATQDNLEPVLLAHARQQSPGQIRFDTQLASLEQREDYVLATIVHRPSGRVRQVYTKYLIGADGSHSTTRQALNIRMIGQPFLTYRVNILFQADLTRWVGDREINICFIPHPEGSDLLFYNGGDHWRFTTFYHPEEGQRLEDFTPERCVQLIRAAVGVPDLAFELGEIMPWNDLELIAERFYDRRVFLAGDATHAMSPAGGFAMNVGIADVHNLAWKLAAVLKGWSPPMLLSTYEDERVPVAREIMAQTSRALLGLSLGSIAGTGQPTDSRSLAPRPSASPELYREHGLIFGATYDSSLILRDGTPLTQVANPVTDYIPNARPGSRAPHVWLERDGACTSTLDLFGREFVLLTGTEGQGWCDASQELSNRIGIPLRSYRISPDGELTDPGKNWAEMYGIEAGGAVLVRPDGYVAWRSAKSKLDHASEIEMAWNTALGRRSL